MLSGITQSQQWGAPKRADFHTQFTGKSRRKSMFSPATGSVAIRMFSCAGSYHGRDNPRYNRK
ncbi:hypothetical protein AB833_29225 [Chromatiales bacterium (ex Bugula neritina AB1)]|nr:hypothetical protein AB833_29225 [Chromatiales bacterium (ex Bugula neritina AB1)]